MLRKELVSKQFVNYVCDSWDGIATYLPLHTGWWFEDVEKAGKTVADAIIKFKETSTKEDYESLKGIAEAAVVTAACRKSKFNQQLATLVQLWKTKYLVLTNGDKKEEDSKELRRLLDEATATIKQVSEDHDKKVAFLQSEMKSFQTENARLAEKAKMFENQNQELLKSLSKQGSNQAELISGMSEKVVSLTAALSDAKSEASQKATELSKMTEELRQIKEEAARSKELHRKELEAKETEIAQLQERMKEKSKPLTEVQTSKTSSGPNGLHKQLPGLSMTDSKEKDDGQFSVVSGGSAQSGRSFFSTTNGENGESPSARDTRYINHLKYGVNPKYHEVYVMLHQRISENKEDVRYEKAIMAELLYRNACALIASDPSSLSIDSVLIELEEKCSALKPTISLVKAGMKQTSDEIPVSSKQFKPLGHIESLTSKGYCNLEKEVVGKPIYQHIENVKNGGTRCSPGQVAIETLVSLEKAEKAKAAKKLMPPPAVPPRSRANSQVGR